LTSIEVANLTGGGSANSFTVSGWTGTGTLDGAGGSDTVAATNDVANFTLTDTTLDRTGTGQLTLTSIEVANLTGGGSANTFTVSGWTGTGTLDGAGGSDTVVAVNDVATIDLADTSLARAGSGTLTLSSIEVANLTGGGSANSFTVSGWTGTGTLDGAGGSDTVAATNDVANFTLTDTTLDRTGTGQLTLTSIEVANLTGGGSANSFTVSGWTGSASITGGGGSDTLVGPNTTNTWTISGADDGSINGTITFTDIANLTSFTGDNTADTLIGTNANTTWTINGTNDGSLSTGQTFTDIPNLTGGTLNDSFVLSGGSLDGAVNGGLGANTLTAGNVANTWTINGANTGTVTGVTGGF